MRTSRWGHQPPGGIRATHRRLAAPGASDEIFDDPGGDAGGAQPTDQRLGLAVLARMSCVLSICNSMSMHKESVSFTVSLW